MDRIIRTRAELRRNQVADNGSVKGVTGQRQTGIADDALFRREINTRARPHAHQEKSRVPPPKSATRTISSCSSVLS